MQKYHIIILAIANVSDYSINIITNQYQLINIHGLPGA